MISTYVGIKTIKLLRILLTAYKGHCGVYTLSTTNFETLNSNIMGIFLNVQNQTL